MSKTIEASYPLLPYVSFGTTVLDCSRRSADAYPHMLGLADDYLIRLIILADSTPIKQWLIKPQPVSFHWIDRDCLLYPQGHTTKPLAPISQAKPDIDISRPLALSINGEVDGVVVGSPIFAAVLLSAEARRIWNMLWTNFYRLQSGSWRPINLPQRNYTTIRVVARNIVSYDAVGNFSIGCAGFFNRCGYNTKLYAYTTCQALAGVASIGDLTSEVKPDDLLFYHYSIEDEFLPILADLPFSRKILYYHNVTPGDWFRPYDRNFAELLDRSRQQFPIFQTFDGALTNSAYSLDEIRPYLRPEIPVAIHPPTFNNYRLLDCQPVPVALPDAKYIILWVGRIAPHKRPELASMIVSELIRLNVDVSLIFVGSGRHDFPAYNTYLDACLAALPEPARTRIHFLQNISDGQLAYLYRNATLLLCTSAHEGYCMPIAEATTFDLPVAVTPQAAMLETLNGRGIILPESPEAAAEILRAALTKNKLRQTNDLHQYKNEVTFEELLKFLW